MQSGITPRDRTEPACGTVVGLLNSTVLVAQVITTSSASESDMSESVSATCLQRSLKGEKIFHRPLADYEYIFGQGKEYWNDSTSVCTDSPYQQFLINFIIFTSLNNLKWDLVRGKVKSSCFGTY
ncbi:hypothetical protein GJAV_G00181700 [Gymnothorax javanicus]|nr:hypothetical protein GJAV_G00181700 [Gymnothorax javanicus]